MKNSVQGGAIQVQTGNCLKQDSNLQPGLEVIKNFMLNSAEHEILNAHKCKNIKKLSFFQAQISLEHYFSSLINVKCNNCWHVNIY